MFSILYVDDEPGLLEIGKLFLEQSGQFTVETLTSATEALEILRKKRYDAIISDYQMPVMDGIGFLKNVRASDKNVPFIIFTGRGREEIVIQAFNEGADFYLQKGGEPLSQFAELGHKITKAILQRRAEASIRDHERREADIINFLPDATFAIDTRGVLIAWNRAMEKMTGVSADSVLGKGNYEYALPFYHERRPLLINLVLDDDPAIAEKYPFVKREGKTLFSEITIPHFNEGRGAALWFTASPLYDKDGAIVGAIESIREISDWKRAEQALNESERRFRDLADMLPLAIYETDEKANLTYANRMAFELFGYTPEILRTGMNVMAMLAPEDRDRARARLGRMISDGKVREDNIEYRALRRDGSTFPVSIYSSPVLRDGKTAGVRGIIIDITERRTATDNLHASEEKYRTVFETTGTATVLIEDDGTISLANSEFARLSGYPKGEIENRKKWTEFVVEEDLERMLAQHRLRRIDRKHALTHYEFRFRSRSGEIRDIYLTIDVIPGTTKSVASLLDITERKNAERSLVAADQEYKNLLDQIQDVYYRSDAEGRLVKVSRSWATLLGYDDVGECIGRRIAEDFYFTPGDRKAFLDEIYRNGKVTSYEVMLKKKDGTPVLVATSSHLYRDAAGNVAGVEGTFRDITKQKQQENILRIQRDLGMRLQELRDRDELLDACLDAAIRISEMDAGGIYLVDEATGSVDLALSKNLGKDFVESVSRYAPGSANAQIVFSGKPLYTTNAPEGVPHSEVQDQEGLRALAVVPVFSRGRIVGYLNTASHTRDDIPHESRIALEMIATQIGSAIGRAKADEALIASEQRYRNIVEDQTEFICRFRPDGTHVFVNDAYCRYFGLSREEIIGHRFRPDIPPADRPAVRQFFMSLTPEHPVDIIVHRIAMPDGSIRWQRWSDRAIFDDTGKPVEYQSVGRDITETKEAEAAMLESEARYRSLSEASQDLIFVIDRNDRIVYVNGSAANMFGCTVDKILGRERNTLFPPDVSAGQKKAIDRVLATGKGFRSMGKLSFRGQERWFDHSLMPICDASGVPFQVVGISRDITELKNIEEALRQKSEDLDSRNRLISTLLDTVPIGIFMVEAPTGKPIIANCEATRLLGRGILPDATEQNLAEVYEAYREGTSQRYPMHEMPIVRGMYGENRHIDDMIVVRPDGTTVQLEVFGTPLTDTRGQVTASLVSFLDITDRKRAEKVIREANRKINLLTSITRHDVANQITVLRGYARIAMMKKPSPEITEILQKIDEAISAIAHQIAFTKAYQELGVQAPGWQSIRDIIARQKSDGISLTCTCDAEIYADPMLERVFFNLIDNAARHGGNVTAITVSCRPASDTLTIIVSDNGVGVPSDQKERIFDKGFGKHTGYGLFLAREILAITGITIHETGTPGRGAVFEITVPKGTYRLKA
ncbi:MULTISPECIES: PAS domain S-box protein [unclassified Methanoregula]|uniref:PAS domain S-box protein n=1 Tax=unclassified Methanoregula TaxID=2649730 RepID=UPI0025FF4758|nr:MULTISPECIES: PAS domain S-box protein [unclassified Methanoregula]